MIRVILYLILVGAIAYGVAFFADRPGDVVVTWQGMRIETSLLVLGSALVAAFFALILILSLIRAVARSPLVLSHLLRNRRGVRAYEAISNGLIAVGAGDIAAARKFTAEVGRLAPGEPLALLLSAQSAQLTGDRDAAERAFRAMAGRPDTKALGLHGLFIEARRRNIDGMPEVPWSRVLERRAEYEPWTDQRLTLDTSDSTAEKLIRDALDYTR